jgi:polyhydroxyalkanoate synthesis regulator phasin
VKNKSYPGETTMSRLISLAFVLVVMALSASTSFAQGPDGGRRGGDSRIQTVLEIVSTATGLETAEIVRLMREDDQTLAEIITANGGDLAAVEAEITAALTENFNSNLAQNVDDLLNNPLPGDRGDRGPGGRGDRGPGADRLDNPLVREIIGAISDATELDREALREQIEAGQTLSEIITAAGADPATITATVKTELTERINEAVAEGDITQEEADDRLANLDAALQEALNTPLPELRQQARFAAGVQRALLASIAEALGLQARDLRDQVEEGQTWNDYLTAQGADLTAIKADAATRVQESVAEMVSRGDLTQAEADVLLADLDSTLDEALARTIRKGGREGGRRP